MNRSSANRAGTCLLILGGLFTSPLAQGQKSDPPPTPSPAPTLWERWQAGKQQLREDHGLEVGLHLDLVFRSALAGPESGLDKAVSRYDLQLRQHLHEGALVSMTVRGGWGEGLDPHLGLVANTDQFAQTGSELFLLHLYYQQTFLDEQLTMRVGKFDIGDWLDANAYGFYNFLGYSFAHTPTLPLPGNTLGAMVSYEPNERPWYVAAGFSNAEQTPYDDGLKDFRPGSDWLSIVELGFKPRPFGRDGTYRLIGWHNSRTFTNALGDESAQAVGLVLNADQALTDQLGVFFRFGVVEGDPFEPKQAWSAGLVLSEPLPGRPRDSLGMGVVHQIFSDARHTTVPDARSTETYFELYYSYALNAWTTLQPVVQIVDNPGGLDRSTAIIAGLHIALRF